MIRKSFTCGVLPKSEEFAQAFRETCPDGTFKISNCPRVGTYEFDCEELWEEVQKACDEFLSGAEEEGDWCSSVLSVLGFEWI